MFDKRTRFFFFASLKDAAGAPLKKATLGSDQQKNRLRLRNSSKTGGSMRLRNTNFGTGQCCGAGAGLFRWSR